MQVASICCWSGNAARTMEHNPVRGAMCHPAVGTSRIYGSAIHSCVFLAPKCWNACFNCWSRFRQHSCETSSSSSSSCACVQCTLNVKAECRILIELWCDLQCAEIITSCKRIFNKTGDSHHHLWLCHCLCLCNPIPHLRMSHMSLPCHCHCILGYPRDRPKRRWQGEGTTTNQSSCQNHLRKLYYDDDDMPEDLPDNPPLLVVASATTDVLPVEAVASTNVSNCCFDKL